jgi:hypothetical protein
MSRIRKHSRLLLVAVSCVALGAGASVIAGAGAATSAATSAKSSASARAHPGRRSGLRALARRAVHGDLVIATKAGFRTVTFDRGVVDSVSGRQLSITEGAKHGADRTVMLTIPAGARVKDDRRQASLAAVKPGQRALVLVAPRRTLVIARTPRRSGTP